MRIGIYDPYLDDLGGGEKYMMTIAEYLSRNHDVSVFWDDKTDLDSIKKRFSLDLDKVKLVKNLFASGISLPDRLMATRKYDVIISLIDGSIPTVSAKKLFLHIQQPLNIMTSSSWKNKIKLTRVNGIFYNSQFTKSFNDKLFGNVKSTVIYPPVDIIKKDTIKENIIVTVGRFRVINVKNEDFKKQQIMVNKFKEMCDLGLKSWKLIVATSIMDETDSRFKEMLRSVKGYEIEFLINKNNSELWDIYNKSKIYWHASGFGEDLASHPEYAEHFGISTVEAMGVGVVPVVINAGGQTEIVTDGINGLLWNTLDELEEKTKELMTNQEVWKKLSDAAILKAGEFGKEQFCNKLHDLIER